ncbi:MAG TPA: isochorismatase family cysteine hydrolase [Dehalococcoidia bacterium]|nr:isochorismatase family cysteine hydrolase [Dehalococcoidia bacterium]
MQTLADKVDPRHCLVMVVDVQNDFCHSEGSMGRAGQDLTMVEEAMPHLVELLEEARRVGTPVVFTQAVHSRWTDSQAWSTRLHGSNVELPRHCREGSWGADFYEIAPQENERVLVKRRFSAFYGTDLDVMLRALGIKALIMTGVATNVCVETTARDGFMRDYHIVFLSDCCASYDRALHQGTLRNMDNYFGQVATSKDVLDVWKKLPPADG